MIYNKEGHTFDGTNVVRIDIVCHEDVERIHFDELLYILQRFHESEIDIPETWVDPSQSIHLRIYHPPLFLQFPIVLHTLPFNAIEKLPSLPRKLVNENFVSRKSIIFAVEYAHTIVGVAILNRKSRRLEAFRLALDEPTGRAGKLLMDTLLLHQCTDQVAVVAPSAIGFFKSFGWNVVEDKIRLTEPQWLTSSSSSITPFQALQSIYHGRDITENPISSATRFSDARPVWATEGAWQAAIKGGTLRHMQALHLRGPPLLLWDMSSFYVGAARSYLLTMDIYPQFWVTMKHL